MTAAGGGSAGPGRVARRALRLAHRGDHRRAPENSLAAIRAGVAIAALDGVELDVRSAADGTPILLHDETLARTHGRPEAPEALDVGTLRALGVPTLAEALAAIPGERLADVELKSDVVVAATGALLERQRTGRLVVSSFEPELLERLARAAPSVDRWLNAERLDDRTIDTARRLGCAAVSVAWLGLDRAGVEQARARGVDVAGWTLTRPEDVRAADALDLLAVCVEGAVLDLPG